MVKVETLVAALYVVYILSGFIGVAISVRRGQIPGWPDSLLGYSVALLIGPATLWVALRDR